MEKQKTGQNVICYRCGREIDKTQAYMMRYVDGKPRYEHYFLCKGRHFNERYKWAWAAKNPPILIEHGEVLYEDWR